MRLLLVPPVLCAIGIALCAPAAHAHGYEARYLGLRGSYVSSESDTTTGSIDFDYNQEHNDGFAVALFMGWVLDDNFRLEAEGGFRSADIDDVTIVRDTTVTYPVGTTINAGGDVQAGTAMVNFFYDLHVFDGVVLPWLGAGLGAAYIDVKVEDPNPVATFDAKDSTWVFAYQFMAGITFPVGEGMSMSLGYRFFQTEAFSFFSAASGEEFETDLTQHSVDLGFQFHL